MSLIDLRPGAVSRGWRIGTAYAALGKRGLDVALSALLLVAAAPVLGLMWLAARCDGGPGLFADPRVGRDGRVFRCWKIRTMRSDADTALADLLGRRPDLAAQWAGGRKMAGDPRVTAVGRWLRPTGLDELPQLWNVLCGEMSLVGPRPITRDELDRYGRDSDGYLSVRPGITGLWQVFGRASDGYAARAAFDTAYARQVTLVGDLVLIVCTLLLIGRATSR